MFHQAIADFGTDRFSNSFKTAFQSLTISDLPLAECCQHSGDIEENSLEISLLLSVETKDTLQITIGVFFREILAGCACSDDPSQAISYENGYCELKVEINKSTAFIDNIKPK